MDFKDLAGALSQGGVMVSAIKCPQCGGSCTLPDGGTVLKCDHCGASLKVADVVETLKKVIR